MNKDSARKAAGDEYAKQSKERQAEETRLKAENDARLKAEEQKRIKERQDEVARLKAQNDANSSSISDNSKNANFNCFLTHNWGKRQSDGTYYNHERVQKIYDGLKSRNVSCWFDSERMTGTINRQMSEGIDNSDCVIGII